MWTRNPRIRHIEDIIHKAVAMGTSSFIRYIHSFEISILKSPRFNCIVRIKSETDRVINNLKVFLVSITGKLEIGFVFVF